MILGMHNFKIIGKEGSVVVASVDLEQKNGQNLSIFKFVYTILDFA